MDFTLDWLYLYLQIVVLITIPALEIFRKQGRNLYAILFPVAMLVLVQGQTWWMLDKFETDDLTEMQHLYQTISIDGLRLANRYILLSVIVMGITYIWFSSEKAHRRAETSALPQSSTVPVMHGYLIAAFVLLFSFVIIDISGGIETTITNPGLTFVHGLVLFLLLLWLGKFPFLNNLAVNKENNWLDASLLILVILVFLFNSRFLVFFILLQWFILYNYCRREVGRTSFLWAGIVSILIFGIFGMYRHYVPQYETIQQDLSFNFIGSLFSFGNFLDWFYGLNVEGFAGLAGLLTYKINQGGITHDFGLSNISALFQFIPSSLRFSENMLFADLREFFSSFYPYTGSVIPSGMENAYANFGLMGLLALGIFLGFLMQWFHERMLNPKADRLVIALLSIQSLQLIRGSFYFLLFFILSELIMLYAYRLTTRILNNNCHLF